MLWGLSVHSTSLPFDHVSCLDKSELEVRLHPPVSRNRNQKLPLGVVLSLSSFSLRLSPNTTSFGTSSTPIPVNSVSTIFMFLFCSIHGILRVHFDCGNHFFQGVFFFLSCLDICTRFSHWLDVITNGYCISIQSCHWTYERTALPYSFPDC